MPVGLAPVRAPILPFDLVNLRAVARFVRAWIVGHPFAAGLPSPLHRRPGGLEPIQAAREEIAERRLEGVLGVARRVDRPRRVGVELF